MVLRYPSRFLAISQCLTSHRRFTIGRTAGKILLSGICLSYAILLVSWLLSIGDESERGEFVALTLSLAFLIGSAMGSLDNVLIFRLPRGLPLTRPRHSICSTCRARLTVLDKVPIFSYLCIGGKCRYCNCQIPPRYITIELIQGGVWSAIAYQFLVVTWSPDACAVLTVLATSLLIAVMTAREAKSFNNIPAEA